ncbi:MAG TPA: hypothetical protein VKI40_02325, partial [Terriglobales bacterium]|nr:hypothetical protein [Terriglobales bacterium]
GVPLKSFVRLNHQHERTAARRPPALAPKHHFIQVKTRDRLYHSRAQEASQMEIPLAVIVIVIAVSCQGQIAGFGFPET